MSWFRCAYCKAPKVSNEHLVEMEIPSLHDPWIKLQERKVAVHVALGGPYA